MTKATTVLGPVVLVMALWAAVLFQWIPLQLTPEWQLIWPTLPLWALVTFGAYSLGSVGYNLYTFRDCPDAYEALVKDIADAKADLRAKGLKL